MKVKVKGLEKNNYCRELTDFELDVLHKVRLALNFSKEGSQAEVLIKLPPGGNVYYINLTQSEKKSVKAKQ